MPRLIHLREISCVLGLSAKLDNSIVPPLNAELGICWKQGWQRAPERRVLCCYIRDIRDIIRLLNSAEKESGYIIVSIVCRFVRRHTHKHTHARARARGDTRNIKHVHYLRARALQMTVRSPPFCRSRQESQTRPFVNSSWRSWRKLASDSRLY